MFWVVVGRSTKVKEVQNNSLKSCKGVRKRSAFLQGSSTHCCVTSTSSLFLGWLPKACLCVCVIQLPCASSTTVANVTLTKGTNVLTRIHFCCCCCCCLSHLPFSFLSSPCLDCTQYSKPLSYRPTKGAFVDAFRSLAHTRSTTVCVCVRTILITSLG